MEKFMRGPLRKNRRFAWMHWLRAGCMCFLFAILTGFICLDASAVTYEDGGIRVPIPEGFEGPLSGMEQGAKVVAFVKKYPDGVRGTLLQITTYDFGRALDGMPEDARQDATDKYLAQFLGGVERARQSFKIVSRSPVLLDGIKASRAEWVGNAKGNPMSGVMYCVIVGTRLVVFHTQDFQDAPPSNRKAVLESIKSVSFAKE
jgi:hypothetical protein